MSYYIPLKTERQNEEYILKFLLFFFNPFLGFLYSLKHPATRSSYAIFFLFGMVYAWVMNADYESDFSRIIDEFYTQHYELDNVWHEFLKFFEGESRHKEFYRIFLFGITQLCSSNYHLLFFFASIPYMYFMLKSMKCITTDKSNVANNYYLLAIITLLVLPYNIFWISNFKFSTGVWISVYSLIKILYDKESKYFLLLLVTPLIHSGFWFLVILVSAFYIIPKNFKILKILFYISIPFAFIETNLLSLLDFGKLSFLPDSIVQWGNGYLTDINMLAKFGMYRKDGSGFYYVELFFGKLVVMSYIIGTILCFKKRYVERFFPEMQKFYQFFILYFAVTNFIQIVPTLGYRNMRIIEILFIFLWFKVFSKSKEYKYIYLMLLAWGYNIVFFEIKYFISMLEFDFFYQNLFALIVKNWGVTNYIL